MATNKDQNVSLFIYVTPQMKAKLDKIVRSKGTTMSSYVRHLLDEHMTKQKVKPA